MTQQLTHTDRGIGDRGIDDRGIDDRGIVHTAVGVTPARRHTCDTRPRSRTARTPQRRPAASAAASTAVRPARRRARVTRRGRLLLVVVTSALLLAAFSLGRVSTNAVTDAPPKPAQVTVHSGETLWGVATRIAPKHDPREIVAQLQRLNHLSSPRLVAGQVLLVPRG